MPKGIDRPGIPGLVLSADDAAMEDEGGRRKHQRRGHLRGDHGGPQSAEADATAPAG